MISRTRQLTRSHPVARVCASISRTLGLGVLALSLSPGAGVGADLPVVPAPREPVTNTYHGVAVVEDYQWLENAAAPAVKDWTRQQNERTRQYFSRLTYREGLAEELMQIRGDESARYSELIERKGRIFALRFKPPAQQPVLGRLSSLQPPALWRPVLNLNTYNTNGTTAIDWFVPSPDGKLVAVSLSQNGSEQGTLHVFEADTGKELADRIPRVQFPTGGGSVSWSGDGASLFYTRYPSPGERPEADLAFYMQVWRHRLGTPLSEDQFELGRDFPKIAEVVLDTSHDGRWVAATVANGDGGEFAHYLRDAQGKWTQLTRFEDGIKQLRFGRENDVYLLSQKDAPRGKILRLALDQIALANAKVTVPERKSVVVSFAPSEGGLYVDAMQGGPSELLYYPQGRGEPQTLSILPVSTVAGADAWPGQGLVFGNVSYLKPSAWFTWKQGDKAPRRTALYSTSPVDFDDMEVVREFAVSKDGTKVPVNILRRKGLKLNGRHPALLYGYGGFSISETPGFNPSLRVWFDAGGIYAVANLRGGGEYGEAWHLAGNLIRKQNVFDDFIAAAEHLIKRGYTGPDRLAVEGGSNGGLLMGAFLTQRPELARAVVSHVGLYDMLRSELDPNGQFITTEYGTVKNPEQFKALYAYSPYHRVHEGVAYPAVFMLTGDNDGRVNPAHSRKMIARLQAASNSGRPILLRTTASAGHGMGTALSERIAQQADVYAFLFDQLGVAGGPWVP